MPKDCPISQIVMNYTVMTIATEVPGMTDRGTSNGERGTVLGIYFYTAGTKMFPRSRSAVTMVQLLTIISNERIYYPLKIRYVG